MTKLFERILVPVDGSQLAEGAVKVAHSIGADEVVVAMVLDGLVERSLTKYADSENVGLTELAETYLTGQVRWLESQGIKAHHRLIYDPDAATGIQRIVDEEDVTMLAMTSHGRSGVKRWLLGSVASKLVHAATVPVLVVPAS